MNSHYCAVVTCRMSVPLHLLMCKRHWFMVPAPLRQRIWDTYQSGQELEGGPEPTDEYHDVVRECLEAVKLAEREAQKRKP